MAGNLNPLMDFPYNQQYGYPYFYTAKFLQVASQGQATLAVDIDAGYVFKWQMLTLDRYVGGATIPNTEFLVQITDGRSSRNFFDTPIPLGILCGNQGSFIGEFILPVPHLFDASSSIIVTLTNSLSSGPADMDIVFGGIKMPI